MSAAILRSLLVICSAAATISGACAPGRKTTPSTSAITRSPGDTATPATVTGVFQLSSTIRPRAVTGTAQRAKSASPDCLASSRSRHAPSTMTPAIPRRAAARDRLPPHPATVSRPPFATTITSSGPLASTAAEHRCIVGRIPGVAATRRTGTTRPTARRAPDSGASPRATPLMRRLSQASETADVSSSRKRGIRSSGTAVSRDECEGFDLDRHPRRQRPDGHVPRGTGIRVRVDERPLLVEQFAGSGAG